MTGAEFREARIAAGLSYRQAAAILGVSLRTIQLWEEKDTVPDRATAIGQPPEQHTGTHYTLGQLAAVVETATGEPLPLTLTRYMENNPHIGLGTLMRLYHRLPPDVRREYDERVMDLMEKLPATLPTWANVTQAGEYQLGYYHERAALRE